MRATIKLEGRLRKVKGLNNHKDALKSLADVALSYLALFTSYAEETRKVFSESPSSNNTKFEAIILFNPYLYSDFQSESSSVSNSSSSSGKPNIKEIEEIASPII